MLVYLWNSGIHSEWEVTQLGLAHSGCASLRTQSQFFPRLPKISLHVSHSKSFMLRGWAAHRGDRTSCYLLTLSKETILNLPLHQGWWWSPNKGGFLFPHSKCPPVFCIMFIIYLKVLKTATSNKLTIHSVEIVKPWGFFWFYHPLDRFWKCLNMLVDCSDLQFVHKATSLPIILWSNWSNGESWCCFVELIMKLRFAESNVAVQALFTIWL